MKANVSRRKFLVRSAGGLAGTAGLVALAACGETQVVTVEKIVTRDVPVEKTVIKEVPVEKVVTKIITKEVPVEVIKEVAARRPAVKLEFATDHTSGLRGKSMQWALERWAQLRPDVKVKFIPQTDVYYEKIGIEVAAGTLSEINLLDGGTYNNFLASGAWLQANDILAKLDEFVPENYVFIPDVHSDNRDNNNWGKWDKVMNGPTHGMPFQGDTRGLVYNIDAVAAAGAKEPWDGMRWDDLLEAMKQVTDPDQDIWGANSDWDTMVDSSWGYNDGQYRAMGPDGHLILGYFLGDGWMGMQFAVDLLFKHKVAFLPELRAKLQGDKGSPFAAGNQVFSYGGSVYRAGRTVARVADRFRWSLAPMVWGNVTDHGNTAFGMQPHIFGASAAETGVEQQTVDFGVFLAGPEVQGRVAIDRGHMPVHRDVPNQPAASAPPPEGMQNLYDMWTSPYMRHSQWYAPGGPSALEIFETEFPSINKAFIGEATPMEAIEQAERAVNPIMKRWQERLDRGDVPR
jgi:ABC-type glycerol-3-phosphate transport system substrate-binding protein